MLSEWCHLECVIRSPFLSQSVSVQCSVSLPEKGEWEGEGGSVCLTAVKIVVGVPRGCFGNNVRSRPCDSFFKFMINLWSLSCHPKDLLKIVHPCHTCRLRGSCRNFVFTGYWLLIREKANARNLTLWRQEQKSINIQSQIINLICKKILFSKIETYY